MKPLYLSLICLILVFNCKPDKENTMTKQEQKELSTAEKIANAHGFENWQNVKQINFTFNVDTENSHSQRIWSWNPKDHKVIFSTGGDSIVAIDRLKVDSTTIDLDKGFINDKYWLLVPFQLIWDTTATISEQTKTEAPISKTELNLITITYPKEGGYTPGDAYDIYFNDSYLIQEWIFRKGNSKEPSLTTTFENYQDYKGIKIATDHKMADGIWNLNFTDISIILDE